MIKEVRTLDALTSLVNTADEPETSAKSPLTLEVKEPPVDSEELMELEESMDSCEAATALHTPRKNKVRHRAKITIVNKMTKLEYKVAESTYRQISVRMDGIRYHALTQIARDTGLTHREILLEAFDEWLANNTNK